jgi:hypothetical protein
MASGYVHLLHLSLFPVHWLTASITPCAERMGDALVLSCQQQFVTTTVSVWQYITIIGFWFILAGWNLVSVWHDRPSQVTF